MEKADHKNNINEYQNIIFGLDIYTNNDSRCIHCNSCRFVHSVLEMVRIGIININ